MIRRPNSAFTLAELIVAAVLTAMIGGATVAMVRSTGGARQLTDRRWRLQQEAAHGADAIAAALRNAWTNGQERYRLVGADGWLDDRPADALRLFVTTRATVRPQRPESDVMECEFGLARPEDLPDLVWDGEAPGTLLVKRIDPTLNEEPDRGGVVYRLARNVVLLDVQYFDGVDWLDDWPADMTSLPMAVRVTLGVAQPAEEVAPGKAPAVVTVRRWVAYPPSRGGGSGTSSEQSGSAGAGGAAAAQEAGR